MYRRSKKSSLSGLVSKSACASITNAVENLISPISSSSVNSSQSENKKYSAERELIIQNDSDESSLIEIFSTCGMNVTEEPSNVIRTDQAVFIRTLSSKLCSSNLKLVQFVNNFKKYNSNNERFLKSLSPTVTSSECDIARGSTQESLIRLLLQVDSLQSQLSEYLLDRLGELALQNNDLDSEITSITWVKLILQPFRYLNCIANSKKLCERLFDIIFSSPDKTIQQEVIICLPDIIADTEHHFAANELSKLLGCELELTPSILDALANLSMQSEIRRDVKESLIGTLTNSPVEYLPNIVKFLLSTCDSDSYDEIINGLRNELYSVMSVSLSQPVNFEKDVDIDNIQVLVFTNIRNGLLASKQLVDAWVKNISQISLASNCRPLDILIILILYDISTESTKKRAVESLFRNRIKNAVFKNSLIGEIFKTFIPVVQEYFSSLMSISSKLLKSLDASVTDFVTLFYLGCFENMNQQWCKIIIKELLAYIGAGDTSDAQTALNALSEIAAKYSEKVRPLSSMLKVLLSKTEDLPLNDVQQLMDVLCCIAFSDNGETDTLSLKAEITNLVEKQIASSNIKLLRIGIVSVVMAIKHITICADDETNVWPDKSTDDFEEDVLSQKAKKAVPFLKLILDGTRTIPEAQGFAFDQFSLMLMKCRNLDKSLLFYTSMIMKENMKKYFLICNDEIRTVDFMECVLKFGLNEDDEFVVLNLTPTLIVELSSNASAGFRMYSLVLPSLLRLIRGLEYEDLREIDGLLECPVMVPAPKVFDEFSIQSPEVQTVVMDSLFHLTNWFREIVNCFARMIKQPAGKKVLVRLRTLIWLQKQIAKYLPQILVPDYCPPKCHFHRTTKIPIVGTDKKKKKITSDKKRKRSDSKNADIRKHLVRPNGTQASVQEDVDENTQGNDEIRIADMKTYKQFFRELDLDIWILLSLPLTINPEQEKDWEFKPEFGPSELLFIMEDLVEKLNFVLVTSNKKTPFKSSASADIGLTCSSLYIDAPQLIVKNMIKLMPRLCAHLEVVDQFCQTLLKANDNVFDSTGMFLPETREIKNSFSLILKTFSILFSWSGFEGSKNEELFNAGLSKIAFRKEATQKTNSVLPLVSDCVKYFANFQETILHLEAALNLVTLIEELNRNCQCKETNKILGNMCWNFLSHHWYDWEGVEEKGAAFNRNIEYLLTTFFNCSFNKLKAVHSMAEWVKDEVTSLNNKDSSLTTLPNINKGNCNILLRVLLKVLTNATKQALENCNTGKEKLTVWLKVMDTMDFIVSVLKCQPVRINLICFVKGSAHVLRLFLTHGITTSSDLFRTECSLVSQILKTLQVTTRYLQKIFDNTKLTEDSALCAYLPSIRSLLESILLKVKNIMIFNKCTEAFFVGSMRNKDLQGQDILSQSTNDENSEQMDIDDNEPNGNSESIEVEDDAQSNDEDNSKDQEDNETKTESDTILENESDSGKEEL